MLPSCMHVAAQLCSTYFVDQLQQLPDADKTVSLSNSPHSLHLSLVI